MPHSSHEGKQFALDNFRTLTPRSVLDIGVGAGTWAKLLRGSLPQVGGPFLAPGALLHGVEAWAPYIQEFSLVELYDAITVADARFYLDFLAESRTKYDAVILGDVLEHMPKDDAIELWKDANRVADEMVVASLPIVHYPQGAHGGNPYEKHVKDDWSHAEVMESFPGITESWTGTEIGVYVARVW
jgi:hypothetical protein